MPLTLLITLACAEKTPEDTAPPVDTAPVEGFGDIALRMQIDDDYGEAILADGESLVGTFRGSLYLSEQVTGVGPDEGAEALASVFVETVDLSSFEPTDVLLTVEGLPSGYVTALGFFDSDNNVDPTDPGPDTGDPVTLPFDNELLVVANTVSEGVIFLGFRNP